MGALKGSIHPRWVISQESNPTARWPAHLSENGGFIGRLVLLLLLGGSLLHLLPVGLLFPVCSLWLQMQTKHSGLTSAKRAEMAIGQRSGAEQWPPKPARAQAGSCKQDSISLTSQTSDTQSSFLEPFPSLRQGSCH